MKKAMFLPVTMSLSLCLVACTSNSQDAQNCYNSVTFPEYHFGNHAVGGTTVYLNSNLRSTGSALFAACVQSGNNQIRDIRAKNGGIKSGELHSIQNKIDVCQDEMMSTTHSHEGYLCN